MSWRFVCEMPQIVEFSWPASHHLAAGILWRWLANGASVWNPEQDQIICQQMLFHQIQPKTENLLNTTHTSSLARTVFPVNQSKVCTTTPCLTLNDRSTENYWWIFNILIYYFSCQFFFCHIYLTINYFCYSSMKTIDWITAENLLYFAGVSVAITHIRAGCD